MLSVLNFDEINKLSEHKRAIPFEKYFGEMNLSDGEKKTRIAFANSLHDECFVFIMLFMLNMLKYQKEINWQKVREEIIKRYRNIADEYIVLDFEFISYIESFADEFIETTQNHADEPYYYSDDRANVISENETNTARNYDEYQTAIAIGKTSKKWITQKDELVRDTHWKVDELTIEINELFHVGHSFMRFPHDPNGNAEEVVNCRCTIKYF